MNLPDTINGCFEFAGGLFIVPSILKLWRKREAAHWVHMSYFTLWGFWNLAYYPMLDQWLSFCGGLFLVLTNAVYLSLIIWWARKPLEPEPRVHIDLDGGYAAFLKRGQD